MTNPIDAIRHFRSRIEEAPLLFGTAAVTAAGDVVTTGVGLHIGIEEQNPFVVEIVSHLGLTGLVIAKIVALMVVILLPDFLDSELDPSLTFRVGCASCVLIGGYVTFSNAHVILVRGGL